MINQIRRVLFIAIGAIGGFFLGLTLGQILGIFIGNLFDMFGFSLRNANGMVISGFIGLACGAIIGGSILSLSKIVLATNDKPLWGILASALIGLAISILSARGIPRLVDYLKFSGLGQSVGLEVGAEVGCFSGILVSIKVNKIQVIVTEEEKRVDDQYAQFLKNRAKR